MRFGAPAWFWPGLLFLTAFGAPCFAQAPVTNGLVARWSGDGNAKDSAGHYDGQVSGGLRYVPGPAAAQAFQFGGGNGQGLDFVQGQIPPVTYTIDASGNPAVLNPGENAQVDFGNSIGNFGTRDFTIAFWMKTDSQYRYEAFLGKRPTCDAAYSHWNIFLGSRPGNPLPGFLHLGITSARSQDPGEFALFSTRPVNDGQWHHVAWVRQSTSAGSCMGLLYLDGALDNSKPYRETVDVANQASLLLGQHVCQCCDGCHAYSGAAAELQIFSHALTAEEILTIYKAGKTEK